MTHLCTNCLHDGHRTPIEGKFKQCEPCRVKRRMRQKTETVTAYTDKWRAEHREQVRKYNRDYYHRRKA